MAGLGFSSSDSGPKNPTSKGIQFVKSSVQFVKSSEPSEQSFSSPNEADSGQNQQLTHNLPFDAPANGSSPTSSSAIKPLLSLSPKANFPSSHNEGVGFGAPKYRGGGSSPKYNNTGGSQYRMGLTPGRGGFAGMPSKTSLPAADLVKVPAAQPLLTKEEYYRKWQGEKNQQLAKFRKLAFEVVNLKTHRPNAIDKLMSAANRVPINIEFNTEPVFHGKGTSHFICHVFIDTVTIASGQGAKVKDSKVNAYEAALQIILMPHLRIVTLDPKTKELHGSKQEFTLRPPDPAKVPLAKNARKVAPSCRDSSAPATHSAPIPTAGQHRETNIDVATLKRRFNEFKPLEDFVIVEPKIPIPDCTSAHTLRRSADFNHMLLEYEYFFKVETVRCVLKLENQILADVNGGSKLGAKNLAATQGLSKLKEICWIIKTKQPCDSDVKISKEEMIAELDTDRDVIKNDNIGHKLLSKMGWTGGGVGKDGSGIAVPVNLKSVLNRQGLGLSTAKGITDGFRRRVRDVVGEYASSGKQEDLVFSCDFRLDERQIIHDECRRVNLRSKSRGKGQNRYLVARRKRTAFELFDHIMACGGETVRYALVPPGADSEVSGESVSPGLDMSQQQQQIGQSGPLAHAARMDQMANSPQWQGSNSPSDEASWDGYNSTPRNGPNSQFSASGTSRGQWNGQNDNFGDRGGWNGGNRRGNDGWNGSNRDDNDGWNGPNRGGNGGWNRSNRGGNAGWNGPNRAGRNGGSGRGRGGFRGGRGYQGEGARDGINWSSGGCGRGWGNSSNRYDRTSQNYEVASSIDGARRNQSGCGFQDQGFGGYQSRNSPDQWQNQDYRQKSRQMSPQWQGQDQMGSQWQGQDQMGSQWQGQNQMNSQSQWQHQNQMNSQWQGQNRGSAGW